MATQAIETPTAKNQDTMTLAELALRLGISMTTAYESARANRLPVPVIRVGRQFRFSRHAYDRLMDRQHETSTGD